jgi:thiol-disulfide isomerase/thioredoxin
MSDHPASPGPLLSSRSQTAARVAQVLLVALGSAGIYAFARAANRDFSHTSCTALCGMQPAYAAGAQSPSARLAPDFELKDQHGVTVRLSQFRGRVVALNFWSTTCKPCIEEMPALQHLAKVAASRDDLVLLTISTDETYAAVEATLAAVLNETPAFPILMDPEGAVVADRFGTKLYPETWWIDPNGIIRARFDGARDWSQPLVTSMVDMLNRPFGCSIELRQGKAVAGSVNECDL